MTKAELLDSLEELDGNPKIVEALRTIVRELPNKPMQEDHGASYWLLGRTNKGHALVLTHYPE